MTYETRLFINNEYCTPLKQETFPLRNPATEKHLADISIATKEDVDHAVDCAEAAQPAWAALPVHERVKAMYKLADLLDQHAEKIVELDAISMGKPKSTGMHMAHVDSGRLRFDASLAQSVLGESSVLTPGQLGLVIRQPYGVCGDAILPWNVPITMLVFKLASVAAGNAIIIKTSEKSPLSGAYVGRLIAEAGFPAGIIQIISGGGSTGKLLAEHMRIRKISFTGSLRTGRLVAQAAAASNLKNVSLELGGKSPTIIFDDANLAEAAGAASMSVQFNSGQACIAGSRIYVHENVKDKFLEHFKAAFGSYKHGDPLCETTTLGPLADEIQGKAVLKYLEIGKKEGKLVLGGHRLGDKGYFVQPTIFTNVADDAQINKEEVFGPVVVIHTFKDEKEVVRRANDTEYGLYASVFTKDINRAIRVSKALEAGTVTVNTAAPTMAHEMPFGGWKGSGMGREIGIDAVKRWTEEKSVLIKYDA